MTPRLAIATLCSLALFGGLGSPAFATGQQTVKAIERVMRVVGKNVRPGDSVTVVNGRKVSVTLRPSNNVMEVQHGSHLTGFFVDGSGKLSRNDQAELGAILEKEPDITPHTIVKSVRTAIVFRATESQRLKAADPKIDSLLSRAGQWEKVLWQGHGTTISSRQGGSGPILVIDRAFSSSSVSLVEKDGRYTLGEAGRERIAALMLGR